LTKSPDRIIVRSMKKHKKNWKEIGRVTAGCRGYTPTTEMCEEVELNITAVLDWDRKSWRESVAHLIKAGATRVTIRSNPAYNKQDWTKHDFFIFTGYVEDNK
jgi:hypothetical protein